MDLEKLVDIFGPSITIFILLTILILKVLKIVNGTFPQLVTHHLDLINTLKKSTESNTEILREIKDSIQKIETRTCPRDRELING